MGDTREGNVYGNGTKDLSPPCLMGAGWCFYMLDARVGVSWSVGYACKEPESWVH